MITGTLVANNANVYVVALDEASEFEKHYNQEASQASRVPRRPSTQVR